MAEKGEAVAVAATTAASTKAVSETSAETVVSDDSERPADMDPPLGPFAFNKRRLPKPRPLHATLGRTRSRERRSSDVGLMEAHGLLNDLINDTSTPSAIQSKLQQVMEMLTSQTSFLVGPSASPLPPAAADTMAAHDPTVERLRQDRAVDPHIRNAKVTPLRRFSTSVWTTVTTATGMPAVEEQPLRKRSPTIHHFHRSGAASRRGTVPTLPSEQRCTELPPGAVVHRRSTGQGFGVEGPFTKDADFRGGHPLFRDDTVEVQHFSLPAIAITSGSESGGFGSPFEGDLSQELGREEFHSSVEEGPDNVGMPSDYLSRVLAYDMRYDGKGLVPSKHHAESLSEEENDHEQSSYPGADVDLLMATSHRCDPSQESVHLDDLNCWDFPIFNLAIDTRGHVLSVMINRLFEEADLFDDLNIQRREFTAYFQALEENYRDNPYHNRIHAADVLHGTAYLLNQRIIGFCTTSGETPTNNMSPKPAADAIVSQLEGLRRDSIGSCFDEDALPDASYGEMCSVLQPLELAACYIAAAQHDFDHPARTNAFLVASSDELALLYNDRSVLEHHHAASSWRLMLQEGFNFLGKLTPHEYKTIRFLVLELILATDLAKHFEMIRTFNAKVETSSMSLSEREDRLMMMQMCIKIADINGPAKSGPLHRKWAYLIAEEFYDQGDQERSLDMPISPYMDRLEPKLPKLQVTFIGNLLRPLLLAYANGGFMPGPYEFVGDDSGEESESDSRPRSVNSTGMSSHLTSILLLHADANERFWKNVIASEEAAQRVSEEAAQPASKEAGQQAS